MGRYIERLINIPALVPDIAKEIREDVKTGRKDKFGVRNVNFFFTKDGHAFCVVESPTVDALIASHKAKGITVERKDIHEIIQTMADYFGAAQITSKSG